MYERILVPTDGSDCTRVAVEEAIGLAERFGATLHTVYAVDAAALPGEVDSGAVTDALEAAGEGATREVVDRARQKGIDTAEPAVVYGRPHHAILEHAEEADVDLVVMGTHGRSGFDRWLLGSVTEKVVRASPVPVLTVRPEGEDEGQA